MNIYGHIKNANNELAVIFNSDNIGIIRNELIILAIKASWLYLSKYIKNVVPDWTQYFKDRLENIKAEELIITMDMVQDAHRQYERMVEEHS